MLFKTQMQITWQELSNGNRIGGFSANLQVYYVTHKKCFATFFMQHWKCHTLCDLAGFKRAEVAHHRKK